MPILLFSLLLLAPVFAACDKIDRPVVLDASSSGALEITSLSPAIGPPGTTITILGTGFGDEGPKNRVLVDEIAVTATTWADTRIEFTIPTFSGPGLLPIRVRLGRVRSNEVFFEHQRPWLDARSPASATEGTSVNLQGVYLGTQGTVTVEGQSVPSSSWSAKHIGFFASEPTAPVVQRLTAQPTDAQATNVLPIGRMMPVDDAPTPRGGHVAVWTGREMIIWGGYGMSDEPASSSGSWLATGARYNAVTDSWVVLSTVGAPDLSEPVGVWSGKEVLVWGNNGKAMEGARYDPAADAWTPIDTFPLVRRNWIASLWADSEMFVWGGEGISGDQWVQYGDGGRYNPATNSWSSVASEKAPEASRATAVWTGDEILVASGRHYDRENPSHGRFDGYDPITNRWLPLAPQPISIFDRGVWDGSKFIVFGRSGYRYDSPCTAALFYPASNTWAVSQAVSQPFCRTFSKLVAAGSDVLMVGGDGGDMTSPLNSIDIYKPAMDRWATQIATPVSLSANASAVWTGNALLLWGGMQSDSGGVFTDIFGTGARLDVERAAWTPLAGCANVRRTDVAEWIANYWTCEP